MPLQVIQGVSQAISAVLESSQTRVAAVADEVSNVPGTMVVIRNNFRCYMSDRVLLANRTAKRSSLERFLFHHLLRLLAFWMPIVDFGSALRAAWSPDDSFLVVLIFWEFVDRKDAVAPVAYLAIKLVSCFRYVDVIHLGQRNRPHLVVFHQHDVDVGFRGLINITNGVFSKRRDAI